jgi:hypothetical protein
MLEETRIETTLKELGYRRLKRFFYRGGWSNSDVEHFLYLSVYGKPKDFLTADFGLRNEPAQTFAFNSLRTYGGDIYQLKAQDLDRHWSMRFSLGHLAKWRPRVSLHIPAASAAALAEKIKADIQVYLFPIIRGIIDTNGLLHFLLSDVDSYSWAYSNGALRAAMIVYLAAQDGMNSTQIRAMLAPYSKQISFGLVKASDPALFLDRVIQDALALCAIERRI